MARCMRCEMFLTLSPIIESMFVKSTMKQKNVSSKIGFTFMICHGNECVTRLA